jgi:hypothetical protein
MPFSSDHNQRAPAQCALQAAFKVTAEANADGDIFLSCAGLKHQRMLLHDGAMERSGWPVQGKALGNHFHLQKSDGGIQIYGQSSGRTERGGRAFFRGRDYGDAKPSTGSGRKANTILAARSLKLWRRFLFPVHVSKLFSSSKRGINNPYKLDKRK